MKYFPIFSNLHNKPVLLIGSGSTAARKAILLYKFGAYIKIIGDNLCKELIELINKKKIHLISNIFEEKYLLDVFIVIAASNDKKMNKKIFELANKHMKFINVVDDQSKCSFIFPSIVERKSITVAISSDGKSPVLVKLIREKLEILLPKYIGKIAEIAGELRKKVKEKINNINDRRKFWEELFNSDFISYIAKGNIFSAKKFLYDNLTLKKKNKGEVFLVGAGPGNSDLLTIKALQVMQTADIVLYDNLVSKEIINLVRRDATLIPVGKCAGSSCNSQKETNKIMINLAKLGNKVIRLKGGDPFIFGRGGEELEELKKAKINFQVVPGITAAIGASAYSGIPLTHRNFANSILIITGHSKNIIDWKCIAKKNQTIIIYMGILKIKEISNNLILNNFPPKKPVALISNCTKYKQKIFISNVKNMYELSKLVKRPAILLIGDVVKLYKKLNWFKNESIIKKVKSNVVTLD